MGIGSFCGTYWPSYYWYITSIMNNTDNKEDNGWKRAKFFREWLIEQGIDALHLDSVAGRLACIEKDVLKSQVEEIVQSLEGRRKVSNPNKVLKQYIHIDGYNQALDDMSQAIKEKYL